MSKEDDPKQLELDFSGKTRMDDLTRGVRSVEEILFRGHIENLESESWRVRRKGANGLGDLGPKAREAVGLLEAALKDEHPKVREAAANALGKIRGWSSD